MSDDLYASNVNPDNIEEPKLDLTKYENAPVDLPHPFLRRITELVWDTDNVTQEQLDHVKLTLTTFAHLVWPGDIQRFNTDPVSYNERLMRAVDYLCTPITKGSPITPPVLRQGVIPTAPRS